MLQKWVETGVPGDPRLQVEVTVKIAAGQTDDFLRHVTQFGRSPAVDAAVKQGQVRGKIMSHMGLVTTPGGTQLESLSKKVIQDIKDIDTKLMGGWKSIHIFITVEEGS